MIGMRVLNIPIFGCEQTLDGCKHLLGAFVFTEKGVHIYERFRNTGGSGQQEHGNGRLVALYLARHFGSDLPTQKMIRDYEINRILTEQFQRLINAGGAKNRVACVFQDELAVVKPGMFVVNSQNERHVPFSWRNLLALKQFMTERELMDAHHLHRRDCGEEIAGVARRY